ncbi:MAG: hypothetical protein KDK78_11695, partial [Chlamydiia bacterium]|nr:hypothetical protein [Chlamydiia bacterium]
AAGESIVRDREEIHKGLGILSELRREGLPKHILAPVYHFHPKTAGGEPVCSLYYPLGLTTFSGISDSSILRIKGADARSREVEVRALDRVRFGMDIAEALVDLHARRRCVFDIHSDNVLLTFGKEGRMEANLFDMDLLRSFGKIADLSDFGVECRPWLGMYTLNTMEAGSWTDVIGLMEALDACLFAKSGSDLFMQDLDYWTSPKVEVSDSVADEDRIEALLEQDCYVKKTEELFYKKLLPSATREQIVALQSCSAPDDFARCLTRHGQPWVDPELCRRLSLGIRFYELLREVKRADIRNPEFDTETGRFIPPKQLTAPYILERLGEMHWELQVDVMLQPDLR